MKVDTKLVAEGFAEAERLIEEFATNDNGVAASTLRLVIDCVAGVIKSNHPRFNSGGFAIDSTPITNERLKQIILSKMGTP